MKKIKVDLESLMNIYLFKDALERSKSSWSSLISAFWENIEKFNLEEFPRRQSKWGEIFKEHIEGVPKTGYLFAQRKHNMLNMAAGILTFWFIPDNLNFAALKLWLY